jgi:hypothetical protein
MRTSSLNVGNKMKNDEMGRPHTTYGQGKGGKEMHTGYGTES